MDCKTSVLLVYFQDGLTPPGLWGEQSLVEAQAPWREPVAEKEAVSAQKTATVTLLKSSQSAALLVSNINDICKIYVLNGIQFNR